VKSRIRGVLGVQGVQGEELRLAGPMQDQLGSVSTSDDVSRKPILELLELLELLGLLP
jgi:hypothetical protein